MNSLIISSWFEPKRQVEFVGFNRAHTACFIRDEQGARRAITLHLPHYFDLRFRENPIGPNGSPPVEINRAALHRPACFANKAQKEKFDDANSIEVQCARIIGDDFWKLVTRHKCWLDPKQDRKLKNMLRHELEVQRRHLAVREKEVEEEIVALGPDDTNRAKELREMLRAQFTTIAGGQNTKSKLISIFDVTLKMVQNGWGGLREKLLESEWAKHFGIKLDDIPREATAFRTWIERICFNARRRITHLGTHEVEKDICLNLDPWQWEVLESAILYEIRFADGSRCWLEDNEERPVTDPQEVEDFNRLEEAAEIPNDDRLSFDHVSRLLTVRREGEEKPMGKKGLQKLCKVAGLAFKFPMRRSIVRKLEQHRSKASRRRVDRLKRHNAKTREQKAGSIH